MTDPLSILRSEPRKRRPAAGGVPRPAQVEALLTMPEVADILGVTARTVERLVATGELPIVRISARCVRFRPQDVGSYIEGKLCR